MKFFELHIGTQFDFQGETYQKVSPFVAINLANKQQKMFKRSTITTPIESAPPQRKGSKQEPVVPLRTIERAAAIYQRKISETLDRLAQSELTLNEAKSALDQAHAAFLSELSNGG